MKPSFLRFITLTLILFSYPRVSFAGKQDLIVSLSEGHFEKSLSILDHARQRSRKINFRNAAGNTPLHISVEKNQIEIARTLIQRGALINAANREGVTPLFIAVFNRRTALSELLLTAGADPNLRRNDGTSPLLLAAQNHNMDLVRMMLEKGASPSISTQGSTLLMEAVRHNIKDLTQALIDTGTSLKELTADQVTSLFSPCIAFKSSHLLRAITNSGTYLSPNLSASELLELEAWIGSNLQKLIQDQSPTHALNRLSHLSTLIHVLNLSENEILKLQFRDRAESLLWEIYESEVSKSEFPRKITQTSNGESAADSNPKICFRCLDTLTEETQTSTGPADCACTLCKSCATDLIHLEIAEGGTSISRCPLCKNIWNPEFLINEGRTEEETVQFMGRLLSQILAQTPRWRFCHTENCVGGAIVAQDLDSKFLHCSFCDQAACMECGEKLHITGECSIYKNEVLSRNFIESNLNSDQFQKCPYCHVTTEKNGGCNHMTCKRCKMDWTWKTI